MADQEHLKILRQGVEAWNEWRGKNPDIRPDLKDSNLAHSTLIGLNLDDAECCNMNLIGANLRNAKLRFTNFDGAMLGRVKCRGADLYRASLVNAKLNKAELISANLNHVWLNRANLRGADLSNANLSHAHVNNVDFSGSSLYNANLSHAVLDGSDFAGAKLGGNTFGNLDLSTVKGLDSVQHAGSSIFGIETIYRSKGNIPESFLRGCGVPDDFIAFARSLIGKAVEFYSCFISYSSKNHDFAERLYADLQNKGVRCWFASEDIKIGDKFRQRIDESIRLHDKLLLILSEQSISSPWVEEEVESAIEREHREKQLVLFPVRIDDTVMNSNQAWAASLRRMRHIGDFTDWKNHGSYQRAFALLMRDLKSDTQEK